MHKKAANHTMFDGVVCVGKSSILAAPENGKNVEQLFGYCKLFLIAIAPSQMPFYLKQHRRVIAIAQLLLLH